MTKKSIQVKLEKGLEARPVALLVQIASKYDSTIHIEFEDKKVNAKSLIGMMTLKLGRGEALTVIAEGNDEEIAVEGIERFLSGAVA